MSEITYCGLYLQDFFISSYAIRPDETRIRKNYSFSFDGINQIKEDFSRSCHIGIFALDARKLYSFLYTGSEAFMGLSNEFYFFGADKRVFRDLDYESVTIEEAMAMILEKSLVIGDISQKKFMLPDAFSEYSGTFIDFWESFSTAQIGNISQHLQQLSIDRKIKKHKLDLYGTCMTRFIEPHLPASIEIKNQVTNQNILSTMTSPIEISEDNIIAAYNNMPKSNILNIFKKTSISNLKKNSSKFFIFDLLLEKDIGNILDFDEKYLPYSWELMQTKFSNFPQCQILDTQKIPKDHFFDYLNRFVEFLLSLYDEENIIIHKCDYSQYLFCVESVYHINEWNPLAAPDKNKELSERLKEYYEYICYKLPKAYVIDINAQFACRNWLDVGVHPGHFQAEYYREVAELAGNYILSKQEKSHEQN